MAEETPVVIEPTPVTPVIGPLLAMLRSRKVIVSAVTFLVALLVQQVPNLAPIAPTLVNILGVFGVAVVLGISVEDASKYLGTRGYTSVVNANPDETAEDYLRDLINDVLDERSNPTEPSA